jgi:hypothetical protein
MASSLDIKYKRPIGWASSVTTSLLGSSIMLQGDTKDHRFRHISGFRYKTTRYLLNSMETKGAYDPRFLDFQTFLSFDITDKLEWSFLGNYASNVYHFIPETRVTKFGLWNQPMEFVVDFEGNKKMNSKPIPFHGAQLQYKGDFSLKLKHHL